MKHSSLLVFMGFAGLAVSWAGLVLAPQLQLGRSGTEAAVGTGTAYPSARPGLALQGAEVYRANGCYYCHSRQAQQTGVVADLVLTDVGSNQLAVASALQQLTPDTGQSLEGIPKDILRGVANKDAQAGLKILEDAGAKAQVHIRPTGPDMDRGWALRGSVAADYLQDSPLFLGAQRLGPDLSNIGLRQPDINWHLKHLYAPTSMVAESSMPPYRFLFERRRIIHRPSHDALPLEGEFAPPEGYEVVPTDAARALAAYMVSLRADVPLFEAPFTAPTPAAQPVTNQVDSVPVAMAEPTPSQ